MKKQSDPDWYAKRKENLRRWTRSENGGKFKDRHKASGSTRLSGTKYGAKKRGLDWELTDDVALALIRSSCHYCGQPPINGIDRKDNGIGYIVDNCVPCCSQCNRAKHIQTYSEFQAYLDRIVAFRK